MSVGEGRRAWAYRVDVESLRALLEAALPMLKRLSRRSASNPRTEVESHLETQLERSRRSMEVQGLGVLGPCEYAGDPFAGKWEEAEDPWA